MFGNNNQNDQTQTDSQQTGDASALTEPSMGQPFNVTSPAPSSTVVPSEPSSAPPTDEILSADPGAQPQAPAEPATETPAEAPAEAPPAEEAAPAPDASLPPVAEPAPSVSTDNGELTSIKQEALQQLSPLVDQLDQTPEEKFRTTMMMIQAADNQSLIKTAYDAAQQIKDEKERAQALLDVINEINYFTQQQKKDEKS